MKFLFNLFIIYFIYVNSILTEIAKNQVPISKKDAPLIVETSISIEEISSFNIKELEFSMIFLEEQYWTVKRYKCDPFFKKLKINSTELYKEKKLSFNKVNLIDFWTPNSYMTDIKDFKRIPEQNEIVEISITDQFCNFNLKTRINAKIGCKMNFRNYPNDVQICLVRITSYIYPLHLVYYKWKEPGVITKELIQQINQYSIEIKKFQYNATKGNNMKYSFLKLVLRFENHISHFLMQIVCPTYFIISIVYLNFWIKPDGSPGRFLLTILTFLSLITIYSGNRDKLPALSYANAVDIWMIGNMCFVFLAILELVIVTFKKKKTLNKNLNSMINLRENQFKKLNNKSQSIFTINTDEQLNKNQNLTPDIITLSNKNYLICELCKEKYIQNNNSKQKLSTKFKIIYFLKHQMLSDLDYLFRLWYFVLYIIFNIVYWILLLNRKFDSIISD